MLGVQAEEIDLHCLKEKTQCGEKPSQVPPAIWGVSRGAELEKQVRFQTHSSQEVLGS